jgi:uncharacterized RDD family membrane protein YckC
MTNAAPPGGGLVYAGLGIRLKAFVRDLLVYAGAFLVLVIAGSFDLPPRLSRWVAGLIMGGMILYEPVLVAVAGGTLGHRSLGLRVVTANGYRPVSFHRALLRYVAKAVTGFTSFLFIVTTRRRQALHDVAAGTVVIPRRGAHVPIEYLLEEGTEDPRFIRPSRGRRVLAIAGYGFLLIVTVGVAGAVVYSEECLYRNVCSGRDTVVEAGLSAISLLLLALIVVAGWRGQLWGARGRTEAAPAPAGSDPAG